MVICKDDGNLSATEVHTKTDEYGLDASILEYVRRCRDQDGWGAQHRRDRSESTSST